MARILTIDDSDHIRQLLGITLRMKRHDVTEATNGQEGFDTLRNGQFDLVLCDVDMPVMTGLEFLVKVRAEIGAAAPPILILTAEPKETREQALGLGACGVLAKPFAPMALFEEIERHLPR